MPRESKKRDKRKHADHDTSLSAFEPKKKPEMNFLDTSREIYSLGATAFTGYQLKSHKEAEYKELTGRTKKRQKIPLKIFRGMKEKQAKLSKKVEDEAKEAGIVMATRKKHQKKTYSEKNRKDARLFGPSPNIGFMSGGVYKYKK